MNPNEKELKAFDEFINNAELDGMWLRSLVTGVVYSPEELRQQNKNGKYIWTNPINWELTDPHNWLEYLKHEMKLAESNHDNFKARLWASK